jgi:hypothetical protein
MVITRKDGERLGNGLTLRQARCSCGTGILPVLARPTTGKMPVVNLQPAECNSSIRGDNWQQSENTEERTEQKFMS